MVLLTLLSILAVWRVTHLLQDEDGPFGIFARLQAKLASYPVKIGSFANGFFCFYCLSMWTAIPFALFLSESIWQFVVYWLALSAGAVFIQQANDR